MTDKLSKAQKRIKKKKDKAEASKAKSVNFSSSVEISASKTVKIAPIPVIVLKNVQNQEQPSIKKSVSSPKEAFSTACNLTWCDTQSDLEGEWSWREKRQWTDAEWETQILPSFNSLEKSTWAEILFVQKTGAKRGRRANKHHAQELTTLVKEAQDRWIEIGLEEYGTAFRFRFGGTVRAWGVKLQGHFYLVWWERHHSIYPVAQA
jgi:hypothetical protein